MTADVLNAMGYYSQQYVTPAFIDTTVYNKALRDDDSAEMLDIILDNLFLDVSMLYNWGSLYTKISEMGTKANTNFASLYASIESNIQKDMEKYPSELGG